MKTNLGSWITGKEWIVQLNMDYGSIPEGTKIKITSLEGATGIILETPVSKVAIAGKGQGGQVGSHVKIENYSYLSAPLNTENGAISIIHAQFSKKSIVPRIILKDGVIHFNEELRTILNIKPGSRVAFASNDNNPEETYLVLIPAGVEEGKVVSSQGTITDEAAYTKLSYLYTAIPYAKDIKDKQIQEIIGQLKNTVGVTLTQAYTNTRYPTYIFYKLYIDSEAFSYAGNAVTLENRYIQGLKGILEKILSPPEAKLNMRSSAEPVRAISISEEEE